ncbi:glutamate racemase 2 [Rhodoferax lithotrophicus]|uniref:Glutamate racemase n=1 Tax=Rhodoferax lithotrophicus TaxID=2798804 RepID=A0ABM7MM97_9BURK|nr:glutamate racemase [Rhodoferax sp. MIZ03]BCO27379.1 glutamate racemase 2 [Rhodoferax sp. MIZ03]
MTQRPFSEKIKHPIGVFDSGVGGLSVLKALRTELPFEDFVYVADSGYAPYGERNEAFVIERSRHIASTLQRHEHLRIQALVVACNTATAAAVHLLRQDYSALPIIGVEPALKPAITISQTKRIGVMATRGTLSSQKFNALKSTLASQAEFICQPCDGLADAIERDDESKIRALCAEYTGAIGQFGIQSGEIDTLVLGCTHYPFAKHHLRQLLGPEVRLVDNGEPVARQTRRMITPTSLHSEPGQLSLFSTGNPASLTQAAKRWLGVETQAHAL